MAITLCAYSGERQILMKSMSGTELANWIGRYWILHADPPRRTDYRIFFFTPSPLEESFVHPVTDQNIDFSKTPQTIFEKSSIRSLGCETTPCCSPHGFLSKNDRQWKIADDRVHKSLLAGRSRPQSNTGREDSVTCPHRKGRHETWTDIATLTLKKQVNKIVLISGDSDFVPAAKLARVEEFTVLDAMQASINADLR